MKLIPQQQNGLTLVELLAALSLLSIVFILIWNVLMNGLNSYNLSQSKIELQQESNYIIMLLEHEHLYAMPSYTVTLENDNTIVIDGDRTQRISNPNFKYDITLNNYSLENGDTESITPSVEDLEITLKITDIRYPKKGNTNEFINEYEVKTILSKLRLG